MVERELTITHPVGLHARPAKVLVQQARAFNSEITIQNLSRPDTTAKPITPFHLLQLGIRSGHRIRLRAEGDDEAEAIAALAQLIVNDFEPADR